MFEPVQEVSAKNLVIEAHLLSEIDLAACRSLAEIYSCGFAEAGTVLPDLQCFGPGYSREHTVLYGLFRSQ